MQQTEGVNKFDGARPPGALFAVSHHHTENSAAKAELGSSDPDYYLSFLQ